MLNRTYQMLSAHSTRLNLGTRSLASSASAFNVVAPRSSLDDRHTRMDSTRRKIRMITGKHPQEVPLIVQIFSSPLVSSYGLRWESWSCQRVEIVADQPTPVGDVVPHDVRRRRRPVRTARHATAAASRFEATALRAPDGAERRLLATAAITPPSPTRCATGAAGG